MKLIDAFLGLLIVVASGLTCVGQETTVKNNRVDTSNTESGKARVKPHFKLGVVFELGQQ